jgi:hypothetical protein
MFFVCPLFARNEFIIVVSMRPLENSCARKLKVLKYLKAQIRIHVISGITVNQL